MALAAGIRRFLDQVDPRILDRGKNYFRSGMVRRWSLEDGHVTAEVSGSGSGFYRVELDLDDSTVIGYSCSCPYNWGPVCKHMTAVLMAIQAEGPSSLCRRDAELQKRSETLRRLVSGAERERLESLILEHCREDRLFRGQVFAELSDDGREELENIRRLVRESLEINREQGALDAAGWESVCAVLNGALERARRRISRDQAERGIEIALFILASALELMGEADGAADRALFWTADDAIETVGLGTVHLSVRDGEPGAPLARILEAAQARTFDGREHWRYDLLRQGLDLAGHDSEGAFLETLDRLKDRRQAECRDDSDAEERDDLLRYQLLRALHGPAESRDYLEQNRERDHLCRILVLEKLAERDFEGAESLCLRRLEAEDCPRPGQWRYLLFEIYRDWGKREEQLAQVLELEKTGKEAYRRWRDLVRADEEAAADQFRHPE